MTTLDFTLPTKDQLQPDDREDDLTPGLPSGGSPGADMEGGMDPKSWVNRHGNWIDKNIMPAFRGFNKLLADIGDPIVNSILGEKADYVRRALASGDYEEVKTIVPYLIAVGKGAYIGPDAGWQNYVDSFGKGVGFSAPFFGLSARTFQAAQKIPQIAREGTKFISKFRFPWQTPVGTGTTTPTLYGKIIEQVGKGYTKAPKAAYGIESTMGGLGFAGYEVGEDLFGEGTIGPPLTSLALAFSPAGLYYGVKGGIITPSLWLGKKGYGLAQKGITKYKEGKGIASGEIDVATADTATAKIARSELGNDFKRAIDANEQQVNKALAVEENLQPYADEPFGLTVAEATGDIPLSGTQKSFETLAKPALASKINDRKKNIHNAIQSYITNEFGGDALDRSMLVVYDQVSKKYINLLGKIDDGIISNVDNIKAIYTEGHVLDRQALGRNIQTKLLDTRNLVDTKMEKLANRLKINKTDTLANSDAVEASKIKIANNGAIVPKRRGDAISYEGVHKLIKRFINFEGKLAFQDWKQFRTEVSDELGTAINFKRSRDIKSLAVLKEELDVLGKSFGKINENFKTFNTVYQTERIIPFENAKLLKVLNTFDGKDKFSLSGEQVAKQFLGNTEDAGSFMRLFGDDPIMMRQMYNAVFDELLEKVMVKTGQNELKINSQWAKNLEKYLNINRETLATLNLIKEDGTGALDLTRIEGVPGSGIRGILTHLSRRSAELDNRRRAVTENILIQKLFKKKDASGIPSLSEFKSADELNEFFISLVNPKNAGLLKNMKKRVSDLNNPELSNTFSNIMLRKIVERTGALDNPQKFKQYINDNSATLDTVFASKEHTNNLYKLADTFEVAARIGGPSSGSPNDVKTWMDQLYKQIGTSVQGQTSRFIAVAEGRIGIPSVLAYMLMRAGGAQKQIAVLKLYERAMFDQDLAKTLVSQLKPIGTNGSLGPSGPVIRRINHALWNMGFAPFFSGTDEPELELPALKLKGFELPANISQVIPPVEEEAVVDVAQNIPTDNRMLPNANTITLPDFPKGNVNQGIGGLATNKNIPSSALFPFDATANLIEQRRNQAGRSPVA